jgi:glutamine synthetase
MSETVDSADARRLREKIAEYHERGATRVKLGLTDVDGVIRGKYVSLDKFASLLEKGGGFCDCVLGWDVDDQLYDRAEFTGWHTGFPDARYRVVVATERWLADERCPFFLGEFVTTDDGPHLLCPRTRLGALLERLAGHGLRLYSGFEYEFFVFRETPHSVRDKGFRDLKPLTPGNFGYSVLRLSSESDRFGGLMDLMAALRCDLEGLHCETGPGVWEAALTPVEGLEAADRANLFKTLSKVFFQKQDCMATFMAKWSMRYPGQSGHYHFSLLDASGANVFHDPEAGAGMSQIQRWAVGGLMRYLPEYLAMLAPTVNSYTRLVKGAWAPTAATWGVENRTAAVRVIPGSASRQHIEARVPGADANPYLAAAAVVAAALGGIEAHLEPPAPVSGNAYDAEASLPGTARFPATLDAAADRLEASGHARSLLGDAFVDHFVMSRRFEAEQYARHVNDWQLERYFEII